MRRLAPVSILVFILLAGCVNQPKPALPLAAPAVSTLATQYAGSVISGPTTAPADSKAGALLVNVRWVALAKMPDAPAKSLGSRARLIVAGNTDAPLLGSPGLTASAKLVEGDAARTFAATSVLPSSTAAPIAAQTAALFPGVTSVFTANVARGASQQQSVELRIASRAVSAPTTQPQAPVFDCALTVARHDAFASSDALPTQSESALFDFQIPDVNGAVVLLLPMRFSDPRATVLAASITIKLASQDAADLATIANSETALQQSYKDLAARAGTQPIDISHAAGIESARRALRIPDQQRNALIYIADETNARLAQDVALVGDSSILYQLSQKFLAASGNVTADALPALGWLLDRSAFEILTSLADSPEGSKLPPELATVLTQFAGEAARHSASLDEITHGMSSETDLQNRIIAQNLVFLTDSSPSARVRAFDWLNSRRLAPAGFDPLGTARERRLAIDKATTQP